MKNKIAIIRCEASTQMGAGHAMRCQVLAQALTQQQWQCYFATSAVSYEYVPLLQAFPRLDPEDFFNQPPTHQLLIIDHYDLGINYQRHFRTVCEKILVIDDLANRAHDCDYVLDQTYGRHAVDYQPWVPADCEILTGSQFALLRPEFSALRNAALAKRRNTTHIQKILLNMGGSDQNNAILTALQALREFGYTGEIDVVLGFSAPHRDSVIAYSQTMNNTVTFHHNANMAELMFNADLAIGAAGSTVWERACLGLPTILMLTADNQRFSYQKLLKDQICLPLNELPSLFNPTLYQHMSHQSAQICDGMGAQRLVANYLILNSGSMAGLCSF